MFSEDIRLLAEENIMYFTSKRPGGSSDILDDQGNKYFKKTPFSSYELFEEWINNKITLKSLEKDVVYQFLPFDFQV